MCHTTVMDGPDEILNEVEFPMRGELFTPPILKNEKWARIPAKKIGILSVVSPEAT